ncbi:MAG: terminase large subunit domain-containing protein [Burkholderiales bacterium]
MVSLMGLIQSAPVQELATSGAKCCWCGDPLFRAKQGGTWGPWGCFRPPCFARQMAWSMTTTKGKSGEIDKWLFCPVPKQVEFFEATRRAQRVLYGGPAGPGKSHGLRWGLYRDALRIPNLNCLLLRRTFKELDQTHLRDMSREVEPVLGGRYLSGDKVAKFPNGSVIQAGHCESEVDAMQYLSTEYDRIVFDELVTFPMGVALEIMSRARTSKEAVIAAGGAQVWAGSNPGGRGALWVKSFFIDKVVDPEQFPNYNPAGYAYVHASFDDNPYMDPRYRQTLEELPPVRRRQLLYGDWAAFDGQFFDWLAMKDGQPWHVADMGITA